MECFIDFSATNKSDHNLTCVIIYDNRGMLENDNFYRGLLQSISISISLRTIKFYFLFLPYFVAACDFTILYSH